jgi:hypothetical protein
MSGKKHYCNENWEYSSSSLISNVRKIQFDKFQPYSIFASPKAMNQWLVFHQLARSHFSMMVNSKLEFENLQPFMHYDIPSNQPREAKPLIVTRGLNQIK